MKKWLYAAVLCLIAAIVAGGLIGQAGADNGKDMLAIAGYAEEQMEGAKAVTLRFGAELDADLQAEGWRETGSKLARLLGLKEEQEGVSAGGAGAAAGSVGAGGAGVESGNAASTGSVGSAGTLGVGTGKIGAGNVGAAGKAAAASAGNVGAAGKAAAASAGNVGAVGKAAAASAGIAGAGTGKTEAESAGAVRSGTAGTGDAAADKAVFRASEVLPYGGGRTSLVIFDTGEGKQGYAVLKRELTAERLDGEQLAEWQRQASELLSDNGVRGKWNIAVQGLVSEKALGPGEKTDALLKRVGQFFLGKELERYTDNGTVSVTFSSKKLKGSVRSGLYRVSLQAAVHKQSEDGRWRLTIGTPVITTEY